MVSVGSASCSYAPVAVNKNRKKCQALYRTMVDLLYFLSVGHFVLQYYFLWNLVQSRSFHCCGRSRHHHHSQSTSETMWPTLFGHSHSQHLHITGRSDRKNAWHWCYWFSTVRGPRSMEEWRDRKKEEDWDKPRINIEKIDSRRNCMVCERWQIEAVRRIVEYTICAHLIVQRTKSMTTNIPNSQQVYMLYASYTHTRISTWTPVRACKCGCPNIWQKSLSIIIFSSSSHSVFFLAG